MGGPFAASQGCAFCPGVAAFAIADPAGALLACRDHLLDAIEWDTAFEDVVTIPTPIERCGCGLAVYEAEGALCWECIVMDFDLDGAGA